MPKLCLKQLQAYKITTTQQKSLTLARETGDKAALQFIRKGTQQYAHI